MKTKLFTICWKTDKESTEVNKTTVSLPYQPSKIEAKKHVPYQGSLFIVSVNPK